MAVAYDFAVVCAEAIFLERTTRMNRGEKFMKSDMVKIIREQDALRLDKPKRKPAREPFVAPTPQEVAEYSASIGYPLDGEGWCATYEMKGWCTSGATRMRSWKAAVQKWKSNGWRIGNGHQQAHQQSASLGALQIQLKRLEDEMQEILYPGGAGYKTIPTGDKLARYQALMSQRDGIKQKIAGFAA